MIDNYRQLPLGLYQEILATSNDNTLDDLDRQARIIALLDGRTVDEILVLPLADYAELAARTAFLSEEDKGDHRVAERYRLGDLELIPTTRIDKITAGQFIDFQTLTKDGYDGKLVEILSVILVPKGKTYGNGYDIADVQDAIRQHLCVSDALALLAFFFVGLRKLTSDSLTFSRRIARRLKNPKARKEMLEKIAAAQETLSTTAGAGSRR